MRINHNLMALNASNQLSVNQKKATKNMEKLSSGLRINRASDDSAGLAISEKMRGQIRGLEQAAINAQTGISLIQTAEGALNETHAILQRMRELAVQSANDTNTYDDRMYLQSEVNQLSEEIVRISEETTFNNQTLLDGTYDSIFQIGANEYETLSFEIQKMGSNLFGEPISVNHEGVIITNATGVDIEVEVITGQNNNTTATFKNNVLTISCGNMGTTEMAGDIVTALNKIPELKEVGLYFELEPGKDLHTVKETGGNPLKIKTPHINISTHNDANISIKRLDLSINLVSNERAKMGAIQNRLEYRINNLNITAENLTSAESRIRDADMAKEMMELTKNNILQQASQVMLAQANQISETVLQLLR